MVLSPTSLFSHNNSFHRNRLSNTVPTIIEIQELQKTLFLLKFKCWYYETAMKDGNEDAINAMLPDKLPKICRNYMIKGMTDFCFLHQIVKETIGVGVNEKAVLLFYQTALSFTSISIFPW